MMNEIRVADARYHAMSGQIYFSAGPVVASSAVLIAALLVRRVLRRRASRRSVAGRRRPPATPAAIAELGRIGRQRRRSASNS